MQKDDDLPTNLWEIIVKSSQVGSLICVGILVCPKMFIVINMH